MRGSSTVQRADKSAAYAVASVAKELTVSRTGGVGSIGVVTQHVDMSAALESAGYKIRFIHAGKHKVDGNAYQPLPDDVRARIQARIDESYSVFCATVARNRGLDEKAVRKTEALCFTATSAVSEGLADKIGPLDDAIAAFAADLSAPEEDTHMRNYLAAKEAAIREAVAASKPAHVAEGARAEKERINAIIGLDEAKNRASSALTVALTTILSVEEAKTLLSKVPEETDSGPILFTRVN